MFRAIGKFDWLVRCQGSLVGGVLCVLRVDPPGFLGTCATLHACQPSIQGVRFKRVIMDESSTDRSWDPPAQPEFKRIVFCSGKVRGWLGWECSFVGMFPACSGKVR